MVKAEYVIFDFAGTLATLKPSREFVLKSLLESFGILDRTDSEILDAYLFAESRMTYSSVEETRNSSYRNDFYLEFNGVLLSELRAVPLIQPRDLSNAFRKSSCHWELASDAIRSLRRLTRAEIKIGVLSNFGPELSMLVAKLFNSRVTFSHVIDSASVGLEKPSSDFYEYFLSVIGQDVSKCVYVGDSVMLDFEPAMALGIQTYLVDRNLVNSLPALNKYSSLTHIVEEILLSFD